MTEMYSGLVPIYEGEPDRALFFVFQPRVGGPPVDEVTIWMNGGPGCSSLEGFLQENGYIKWTWGEYNPTINDYSWVRNECELYFTWTDY
jgi:carboxypeptidase D